MAEPVSWLLIEPGWKVVGSDGKEIGKVAEVDADLQADIFSGLELRQGVLGSKLYVPAEHVKLITEGRIELDVTADAREE
jgi:sporulation protein YlmC with PRC-barrel domain